MMKKVNLFLSAVAMTFFQSVSAEVVFDDSFGAVNAGELSPVNNQYLITESRGELKSSNLYHSFTDFNVESGNTALFTGPSSVENIITRVTGNNLSTIDGSIVSEIPGANLWLINPAGFLFGDNSRVDVQGSFLLSTADYIDFLGADIEFRTDGTQPDLFVSSPPSAFGFLSGSFPSSAKIVINNSKITVPENQNIVILGNDIRIKGAFLSAKGGSVSIVSINESGEVIYSDQGLDVSSFELFGALSINSSAFDIEGTQAGRLQIEGGELSFSSNNTDFVSSVTQLNAGFSEDRHLMEKPCELADFYQQGKMSFTVKNADKKEYGIEVKSPSKGALGAAKEVECL